MPCHALEPCGILNFEPHICLFIRNYPVFDTQSERHKTDLDERPNCVSSSMRTVGIKLEGYKMKSHHVDKPVCRILVGNNRLSVLLNIT